MMPVQARNQMLFLSLLAGELDAFLQLGRDGADQISDVFFPCH